MQNGRLPSVLAGHTSTCCAVPLSQALSDCGSAGLVNVVKCIRSPLNRRCRHVARPRKTKHKTRRWRVLLFQDSQNRTNRGSKLWSLAPLPVPLSLPPPRKINRQSIVFWPSTSCQRLVSGLRVHKAAIRRWCIASARLRRIGRLVCICPTAAARARLSVSRVDHEVQNARTNCTASSQLAAASRSRRVPHA